MPLDEVGGLELAPGDRNHSCGTRGQTPQAERQEAVLISAPSGRAQGAVTSLPDFMLPVATTSSRHRTLLMEWDDVGTLGPFRGKSVASQFRSLLHKSDCQRTAAQLGNSCEVRTKGRVCS